MTTAPSALDRLAAGKYVLVTSYRKDGTAVPTPVWAARDGDSLVVWTVTDSYKVRRIRRNPQVTVAPCTVRGKPTGEAVPARAEILDEAGTAHVRRVIGRRYGLTGRFTVWVSLRRRGPAGTVGLRITPTD